MTAPSTSRRVLAGGAAAAAGVAAIATPLVATTAGAAPTDDASGEGASTPQAVPAPGTYESCTAYFGLFKGNSDLVSYEVRTEGPVTPAPVLHGNLVPVLTVQGSGGEVQCLPEPGWTDEAEFDEWLDWSGDSFDYPGTGYYLVPSTYGYEFDTPDGPYTATSTSIRFETDITGATVTWAPPGPPATETGWFPFSSGPALTLTSSGVPETLALIESVGGADAADFAAQILIDDECDEQDPAIEDLADALSDLLGEDVVASCGDVTIGTGVLYRSVLLDVMVDRSLVVVTLTAPTPTTPTTAPAAAAAAAVTPTFTG